MERQGSRSQRAPYARKESRKSFFSKMKDSFRDIMYPSWLAGSEKNEASGSTPGSSTPIPTANLSAFPDGSNREMPQFPNQGFGLPNGQPRTVEYGGLEPGNVEVPFQSPNLPPPISEFTSSLLPLNRLTEKSDSVLANEDTMSQRSDASKSTSGCSSMVPQLDNRRRESGVEKRKASDGESGASRSPPSPVQQPTAKRPRLNVSLSSHNMTWTQRFNDTMHSQQPPVNVSLSSLNMTWTQRFNDTMHSQQPPGNLKRPAFNTSLFGSPFNEESSVLGTSFHESSFYPGKTVFGGRSSLRSSQKKKIDLNQSLPSRLSIPVKSFKAKPKVNPVKEAVTSSTAKRILDVLDRMPTPLSDAKKIPVIVPQTWTQNPSFFSKEVASTSTGPPTRRHTLGGLASISTNRQTSAGPRWDNTVARPGPSSAEFSTPALQRADTVRISSEPQPGPSGSGKVRREKSYHRGSASVKPSLEEEDTVVLAPALRTDFTLPVASVPQFNFGTPSIPKRSTPKVSDTTAKPVVLAPALRTDFTLPVVSVPQFNFGTPSIPPRSSPKVSDTTAKPVGLNFTFSSPIAEKIPGNKPQSPQKVGGFQFSSPISLVKKGPAMSSSKSEEKTNTSFNTSFSTPGFQFSSPISLDKKGPTVSSSKSEEKTNTSFNTSFSTPVNMQMAFSTAPKPKQKSNGPSHEDSGGGGGGPKAASVLKSGSVMDILGGGPAKTASELKSGSVMDVLDGPSHEDSGGGGGGPKAASVLKSGSVMDILGGGPAKTASELKSGSVMDILGGSSASSSASSSAKSSPQSSAGVSSELKTGLKPLAQQNGTIDKGFTSAAPLTNLFKKSGGWECDVCLCSNKDEDEKCPACQTPRPGSKKTAGTIDKGFTSAAPLTNLFKKSGGWECDVCLCSNKDEDEKCPACQTPRPGAKKTAGTVDKGFTSSAPPTSNAVNTIKDVPKTDNLMAKLKPPSSQWECEICLVQNAGDADVCVACQSPKPLKSFKHPPGDWECDTCLVNNKAIDMKCVACNYSRPGPPRTQAVPSCAKTFSMSQPSGFSFQTGSDTSKDSSNASNSGAFKFGLPPDASKSSDSGGLKFGLPQDASKSSDTGGLKFGLPSTSNKSDVKFGASIIESISKTATEVSGFKFGISSGDSSKPLTTTGIKFGLSQSSDSESKKSDSAASLGGFKFGIPNSSDSNKNGESDKTVNKVEVQNSKPSEDTTKLPSSNLGSGFGGLPGSTDSKGLSQPGGFKFGLSAPTDNKTASVTSTSGFQFGVAASTTSSSSVVGFQFGSSLSSNTSLSVSSSSVTTSSVLSQSNVISSQTSETKSSNPLSTNTASFGGFSLPAGGLSSGKPLNNTSTQGPAAPGAGGFSFTSNLSKDANAVPATASSFTGFAFGGAKAPETSANKEPPKPVFGGLSSNPPATSAAPVFGGFNFAQKKNDGSESSAPKRGRDEDTGETAAKKSNFNFGGTGVNTSSTPFQFGAANNTAQNSSSPFVFGQQNTATPQTGVFAFGADKSKETPKPVFGGAVPSTQTPTATPVFGNAATNSVFGFTGQKTQTPSNPSGPAAGVFNSFGSSAPQASAPAGAGFSFGSGNTNSAPQNVFGGASTGNVFGGNAPSTTPAFGATPPAFGAQNTAPVTTAAAPAFGGNLTSSLHVSTCQPLSILSLSSQSLSPHINVVSLTTNTVSLTTQNNVTLIPSNTVALTTRDVVACVTHCKPVDITVTMHDVEPPVVLDRKGETLDVSEKEQDLETSGTDNFDLSQEERVGVRESLDFDSLACTESGTQTEDGLVILKDQCIQTRDPLSGTGIHRNSSDLMFYNKSTDKQGFQPYYKSSRSLWCFNSPVYCVANSCMVMKTVTATHQQVIARMFVQNIDVNKVESMKGNTNHGSSVLKPLGAPADAANVFRFTGPIPSTDNKHQGNTGTPDKQQLTLTSCSTLSQNVFRFSGATTTCGIGPKGNAELLGKHQGTMAGCSTFPQNVFRFTGSTSTNDNGTRGNDKTPGKDQGTLTSHTTLPQNVFRFTSSSFTHGNNPRIKVDTSKKDEGILAGCSTSTQNVFVFSGSSKNDNHPSALPYAQSTDGNHPSLGRPSSFNPGSSKRSGGKTILNTQHEIASRKGYQSSCSAKDGGFFARPSLQESKPFTTDNNFTFNFQGPSSNVLQKSSLQPVFPNYTATTQSRVTGKHVYSPASMNMDYPSGSKAAQKTTLVRTMPSQDECSMDTEASPAVNMLAVTRPTDMYPPGPTAGPSTSLMTKTFDMSWIKPDQLRHILRQSQSVHPFNMFAPKEVRKQSSALANGGETQLRPQLFFQQETTKEMGCFFPPTTRTSGVRTSLSTKDSPQKYSFDFSPPVDITDSDDIKVKSRSPNNKSVLKKKTKEMVSAFYTTSMLDAETTQVIDQTGTDVTVTSSCTSSMIFGGSKAFNSKVTDETATTKSSSGFGVFQFGQQTISADHENKQTSSVFSDLAKGKVYFNLGTSAEVNVSEEAKPKKNQSLLARLKQSRKCSSGLHAGNLFKEFGASKSTKEKTNFFASSSPKLLSAQQASAPIVVGNVFRFTGSTSTDSGPHGIAGTSGKDEETRSALSQNVFRFSGSSSTSDNKSRKDETLDKDKGTATSHSTSTQNVFVFSGSSKDESQPSHFTSTKSTKESKDQTEDKTLESARGSISDDRCDDDHGVTKSDSDTSQSSDESSSSSDDSDSSHKTSSSSSSTSSTSSSSEDESSRMECSSHDREKIEKMKTGSPRSDSDDDDDERERNRSQNSLLYSDGDEKMEEMNMSSLEFDDERNLSDDEIGRNKFQNSVQHCDGVENIEKMSTGSPIFNDGDEGNWSQNSLVYSVDRDPCVVLETLLPTPVFSPLPAPGGVFQFGGDKPANNAQPPQATNNLFQFGSKPAENAQPSNPGFNFNSSQAGLGGTPSFNFSQSAAPGANAFSAAPAPATGERKIKRAVRKLRR